MVKPTREQLPFYNRFMRLVEDENFLRDIADLRSAKVDILKSTYENVEIIDDIVNADEIPSPLHQVMMKYNLPLIMDDFMYYYVRHNEISLYRLRSGVYIVDHQSREASGRDDSRLNYHVYADDSMHNKYVEITLAIPVQATTTQITDAIAQNKQFIRDRQIVANKGNPIKRVKLSPMALRNNEIVRLYDAGLKPSQIVWKLPEMLRGNLTGPDISKIVYKLKNLR